MNYIKIVNDLCEKLSYPNHIFVNSSIRDGFIDELRLCNRYQGSALPNRLLSVTYAGTVIWPWPNGDLSG